MVERSDVAGVVGGSNPLGDPMSYQRIKKKKSKLDRFIFNLQIVRNRFFRIRRKEMFLPQTRKIMSFLRSQSRLVRANNQKVSNWVDIYVDQCARQGKSITLLSQWCISKDLEARYRKQGGRFIPTKKERKLFGTEVPRILSAFGSNGFRVNWWISFNRSYLDSGRANRGIEEAYRQMIILLAEELIRSGALILVDWENDVLGERPRPNQSVLRDINGLVPKNALALELDRHSRWAREEADLKQTDKELLRDVCYQIACEAEEGKLLGDENSPFGDFILIPLEVPERYDFFTLLRGGFKRRIVPALKPYPWRLEN